MHTPGPWTIDMDDERRHGEYRIDQYDAAQTFQRAGLDGIEAEDAANARLIAAAPDLLVALEAVLAHVEDTEAERVGGQCTLCNTYRNTIIRPAIAKARGEAVTS